ncbi:MAG: hypothetical protein HC906_14920 [Bacteroidales bacterium]|nr:hypothetical protein [Bacteroidales bacterium]
MIFIIACINYLFIAGGTLMLRSRGFIIKNTVGLGKSGLAKNIIAETVIVFIISVFSHFY